MMDILGALLGGFWPYVAAAGAAVVALAGAYWRGRKAAQDKRAAQDAKAYQQTMERVHEADVGTGNPDDDREWLANRGVRPGRRKR